MHKLASLLRPGPLLIINIFLGFLLTLHGTISTFTNSSFLETLVPERLIGSIYTISSIAAFFIHLALPKILRKYGNYHATMALLFGALCTLALLFTSTSPIVLLTAIIVYMAIITVMALNIDLIIDEYSASDTVGGIRGIYLTMVNTAYILSPIVGATIIERYSTQGGNAFAYIYMAGFLLLLPVFFVFSYYFKNFKDPEYPEISFKKTIRYIRDNHDIAKILFTSFLLQFFYAIMVVYMPIFLNKYIGFEWTTIGVIFAIMLVPFVLFEAPLGKIADAYLGEKEILATGFIIIAISTCLCGFMTVPSFLLWVVLLFITRIGASMIKIMNDVYFFKVVDKKAIDIINIFRMTRPIAYIAAPIFAMIIMYMSDLTMFDEPKMLDYRYLFFALGLTLFAGFYTALSIKDTK